MAETLVEKERENMAIYNQDFIYNVMQKIKCGKKIVVATNGREGSSLGKDRNDHKKRLNATNIIRTISSVRRYVIPDLAPKAAIP